MRRRAFTLMELVVTLALLLLVTSIASFTFHAVRSGQQDRAATVTLSTAQLAARAVAAANHYLFPASTPTLMTSPGLTFTSGASTGSAVVSVAVPSSTEVVLAVLAGTGHCVLLLDDLSASAATFGVDDTPPAGGCSGSAGAAVSAQITGSAAAPSTVTL